MSTETKAASPATPLPPAIDDLTAAESSLGQALAIIHRFLPKLEEPAAGADVQAALRRAVSCVESARQAHQRFADSRQAALVAKAQAGVQGEVVAIIAAAVAAVLGRQFQLVSVAKVPVPVPHLNVWALEGRTQIFQSHKIR